MKIKTMKAAILVEQDKPLVVDTIELPDKLEYGQVLVKILYSGICGSQIGEISGKKGPDKWLPHLLGHEASGLIEEIGPGVSTVKVGDTVVLHWRKGSGINSATPKYNWNGKTVNAGWITTFNEYAIISENRVTSVPSSSNLTTLPLYGCAIPTAHGVLHNDASIKPGESLLVVGVGGVGMTIVYLASKLGANPIIAVDIDDSKLKFAKDHGATHTINSKSDDLMKSVLNICPSGVDIGIDCVGIKDLRDKCYELTNSKGRTILVGVPPKGEKMEIDSLQLHFGKIVTGSEGGGVDPSYDVPRLLKLEERGYLELSSLITKTFGLEDINEALDLMRSGKALRCIIKM